MIDTRNFNYHDFFNNTDGSLVFNDKDYDLKNVNNFVPTYSLDNKNGTVVTLGKVDQPEQQNHERKPSHHKFDIT